LARTIYSSLFFHGELSSPETATLFTVDEGYTAILRDIDVWTDNPLAVNSYFSFGEGSADLFFLAGSLPFLPGSAVPPTSYAWRGRQVFEEGQSIQATSQFPLVIARLCGYLLIN
jgi:hypothetical protein